MSRCQRDRRVFPGFRGPTRRGGWVRSTPPAPRRILFLHARHAEQLGSQPMASSQYPSQTGEPSSGPLARSLVLGAPSRGARNPAQSLSPLTFVARRSAPWLQSIYSPAVRRCQVVAPRTSDLSVEFGLHGKSSPLQMGGRSRTLPRTDRTVGVVRWTDESTKGLTSGERSDQAKWQKARKMAVPAPKFAVAGNAPATINYSTVTCFFSL